jgi:hypothetical protein
MKCGASRIHTSVHPYARTPNACTANMATRNTAIQTPMLISAFQKSIVSPAAVSSNGKTVNQEMA